MGKMYIYKYISFFATRVFKKKHILIDFFVVFTLFTEFVTCIINFVGIIIGKIVFGVFNFTNTVNNSIEFIMCHVLMVTFKTGEQSCIQSALCSYKCINYEAKEQL